LDSSIKRVKNWQVRVHDLLAKGVAAARHRKGWTQEQTARVFRHHGLTSWRTSTVGSLESGLRRPKLDEALLMAHALEVTLDELIVGEDERVELGDGAVMTPRGIRELLTGGFHKFDDRPINDMPYESFPGHAEAARQLARAEPERERLEKLLAPIRNHPAASGLLARDWLDSFRTPVDAERHAARRLKVEPPQVILAARVLWHRDFAGERDARIGDAADMEPRSLQARRGLVTRGMLGELKAFLDEAYAAGRPGGPWY
jgi:transcriptional regulator with XRE-family HTH domain